MSNPELNHRYLLDQLAQERAEEARAKVQAYINRSARHLVAGCFENGDDPIEGKND